MQKFILNFSKAIIIYFVVFLIIVSSRGGNLKGLGPVLRVPFIPMELALEILNTLVNNSEGLGVLNNGHLDDYNDSLPIINLLDEDLFLMNTVRNDGDPFIEIRNLRNDSVIENIKIPEELKTDDYRQRYFSCINEDRNLIAIFTHHKNKIALFNLKNNKFCWFITNDSMVFHHRIKFNNNFIICNIRKNRQVNGVNIRDEGYAIIDIKTGGIINWWLFEHIGEIGEILNFQGTNREYETNMGLNQKVVNDYFHLNDVEVVNLSNDTKGILRNNDILLSSRNLNAIIHIRGDSIIATYTGDFFKQHDVDVVNANTISVFNNNSHDVLYPWIKEYKSNIIYKDLLTGRDSAAYNYLGLNTRYEGQFEKFGPYNYFENSKQNEVIIIRGNSILYRGQLKNKNDLDKVNILNWCTIFQ
jgi:hypothetical protein